MSKVIISFLGRQRRQTPDGMGLTNTLGYRKARYRLPDGSMSAETTTPCLPIRDLVGAEKLVMFGTSGSMWSGFLESAGIPLDEALLELESKVESQQVTQDDLSSWQDAMRQQLGLDCRMIITDDAQSPDSQLAMIERIAEQTQPEDQITFDVTHGFRHMPMLALTAAFFLKSLRHCEIEHIYYCQLGQGTDGEGIVVDVSTLLEMMDWVRALSAFDGDGDFGHLVAPLQKHSDPEAKSTLAQLQRASLFERITDITQACKHLHSASGSLKAAPLGPIGKIIKPEIEQRLKSILDYQNRSAREAKMAQGYLRRNDLLRAAIYSFEAIITRRCEKKKLDSGSFANRKEIEDDIKQDTKHAKGAGIHDHPLRRLIQFRNNVAHGRNEDSSKAFRNADSMADELAELIKVCFKDEGLPF